MLLKHSHSWLCAVQTNSKNQNRAERAHSQEYLCYWYRVRCGRYGEASHC
jgi:hypothetical protein